MRLAALFILSKEGSKWAMLMSITKRNSKKLTRNFLIACVAAPAIIALGCSQISHAAQNPPTKGSTPQNKKLTEPVKQPSIAQSKNQPPPLEKQQVAPDLMRSEFITLMDLDFKKRDLDGNGKATRIEVEEFIRRDSTAKAQEQNRVLFKNLDTDRNGMLSPIEFAALVPAPKFIDASAEMSRFDINRDQIISLVEYRTATLANFDRIDTDKDGILTPAEISKSTTPRSTEPLDR